MRTPGVFLIALCCVAAQDSKPATRPAAAFDSDAALHELAATVMPTRITKRLEDFRAPGGQPKPSESEIRTARPGGRKVILSAATSEPGAVSALLETARVLEALRNAGELADVGFDIRFECASSRPASRPAFPALIAEIRFDSCARNSSGPALRATLAAPEAMRKEAAARLERLFGRVKGEKGFWPDFEVVVDAGAAPKDRALLVNIEAQGAKSGSRESPAESECRAAVRAARCALMIVAQLAEELRGR